MTYVNPYRHRERCRRAVADLPQEIATGIMWEVEVMHPDRVAEWNYFTERARRYHPDLPELFDDTDQLGRLVRFFEQAAGRRLVPQGKHLAFAQRVVRVATELYSYEVDPELTFSRAVSKAADDLQVELNAIDRESYEYLYEWLYKSPAPRMPGTPRQAVNRIATEAYNFRRLMADVSSPVVRTKLAEWKARREALMGSEAAVKEGSNG